MVSGQPLAPDAQIWRSFLAELGLKDGFAAPSYQRTDSDTVRKWKARW